MKVQEDEIEIPSPAGYTINAVKFFSKRTTNKTIVISSATGVLQKYYAKFAYFFTAKGFVVYTFDYHGIGVSGKPITNLKNNYCNLKSWGSNDQAAVIAFAKNENTNTALTLITHSIGGQILGFNANHYMIDTIVMVASQGGYWKQFKGIHKPKMWFFWYILIPTLTAIFGYFPSKKLGLFENLPKNMVYEWASWGKKKNYMMHFHATKNYFFDSIKTPLLALSFSQDDYAPIESVDWMANQYNKAQVTRLHRRPQKGERHIKHFGFFNTSFQKPLWEETLQWILSNNYER